MVVCVSGWFEEDAFLVASAVCCNAFLFDCRRTFSSGCHGCRPFNFFSTPFGGIGMSINIRITIGIPITVGNTGDTPPMGNPSPGSRNNNISSRRRRRRSGTRSNNRKRRRRRRRRRSPPPPVAPVAAALGAAVAVVQVQYYLHLCTKKSREWVVVQAGFHPPAVAWQTKAG